MPKDESFYDNRRYHGANATPMDTLDEPLVIQVAPTGSFIRREDNPNQAYTPEEVAQQVKGACDAGASMCHLHVRDEDGIPDQQPETYARTIDLIREEHDPVTSINVRGGRREATYGRPLLEETIGRLVDEQGSDYIDMVTSAPLGHIGEEGAPFVMNADIFREWVEYLQELGVKPEIQGYDYRAFDQTYRWGVETNVLEKPYYINHTTGQHAYFTSGPTQPHPWGAMYMATIKNTNPIPDDDMFLGGIVGGRNWLPLTVEAVIMGFDSVRIGMEDAATLYPHKDDPIESCAQVVDKIATIARELGREVATPEQARDRLGLS